MEVVAGRRCRLKSAQWRRGRGGDGEFRVLIATRHGRRTKRTTDDTDEILRPARTVTHTPNQHGGVSTLRPLERLRRRQDGWQAAAEGGGQ